MESVATQENMMDNEEFLKHLKILQEDTINISNTGLYLLHPSCKAIIAEGSKIIPTILQHYQNDQDHYLDIILSNIVGYRDRNWIEWGKSRGFIT